PWAGWLSAPPNTQWPRRVGAEKRLHENYDVQPDGEGDQCTAGINFDPCRPRADILRDYLQVVETVYQPERYFGRVLKVGRMLESSRRRYKPSWSRQLKELRGFFRLIAKIIRTPARGPFFKTLLKELWSNPTSIRYTVSLMALYVHFGPFSHFVARRIRLAIEKEAQTPSRVANAA